MDVDRLLTTTRSARTALALDAPVGIDTIRDCLRIGMQAPNGSNQDCMYRYPRDMDRLDRELLRAAYHDDAVEDHVGFVGPVDDFIDWAFANHATRTRHQHYLMNHLADIAAGGHPDALST